MHSSPLIASFCQDCTWELLPMLLGAWILGYFFWRFFSRPIYMRRIKELESDIEGWKNRANILEANLDSANYEKVKQSKEMALLHEELKHLAPVFNDTNDIIPDPVSLSSANVINKEGENIYNQQFNIDNLEILEGIDNSIVQLLNNHGIFHWKDLLDASDAELNELFPSTTSSPTEWQKQAKLALSGNWEELVSYQLALLDHKSLYAKVEKLLFAKIGLKPVPFNDLKIVEGIGPKTESILLQAGINTWELLAIAETKRLKSILEKGGLPSGLNNLDHWAGQARLAAERKWGELMVLQKKL